MSIQIVSPNNNYKTTQQYEFFILLFRNDSPCLVKTKVVEDIYLLFLHLFKWKRFTTNLIVCLRVFSWPFKSTDFLKSTLFDAIRIKNESLFQVSVLPRRTIENKPVFRSKYQKWRTNCLKNKRHEHMPLLKLGVRLFIL